MCPLKFDDIKWVSPVREGFEANVAFVKEYIRGKVLDAGCGSCPLLVDDCIHVDISNQPYADLQFPDGERHIRLQLDCTSPKARQFLTVPFDTIFSSHMLEDLPTKEKIVECLRLWASWLNSGGYIVLLMPDMQGGRYPTVEEGGNCSHQINVGAPFIREIQKELEELELVQLDTIPHDRSETFDVVFQKK